MSSALLQRIRDDDLLAWVLASLLLLGAVSLLKGVLNLALLLRNLLVPGIPPSRFGAKKGAWAVVTGATTGIGLEFAKQLGQAGFNLVLVARDGDKLLAVEKEILEKSPKTEIIVHRLDFAAATDVEYKALAATLHDKTIGVLVNNVGQSHSYPEYFHLAPEQEALSIMTLNNVALVRVTKLVAPGMVARKRGLILNVSSTSGWAPSPLLSVYAGTKSFVHHFSASLGSELASYGVVVSSLNTHFVVSKLSKIRRANLMTPMPRAYVRSVLGHIGQGSGGVGGMPFIANPYPTHALLQYAVECFAPWSIVAAFVRNLHLGIRKRALRKAEREAKQQ